jgi:hypothetical protein
MAVKKEANPLMKRLGIQPKKNTPNGIVPKGPLPRNPKSMSQKKVNPLMQALQKGATKNLTLKDRIRPVTADKDASKDKGKQTTRLTKVQSQKGSSGQSTRQKVQQPTVSKPQKKTDSNVRSRKQTTVLQIKNAASQKFLRLKNLEIGTTSSDLKRVLESMGHIRDIRVQDLASGSTTAEVMFEREADLKRALNDLNQAVADGRVIHAEISSEHQIGLNF